jgi:hypothetical protein
LIGIRLESHEEVLRRQVHPTQLLNDGKLSSAAFRPTPEHNGLLSTRREFVSAEAAFQQHITERDADNQPLKSVGTWGVSVGELSGQALSAYDDSAEPGNPIGHASVDFQAMTRGQQERASRVLRDAACERGCLYLPS